MLVLMPSISSLEEEVELNPKHLDQEHNQLSELLQEMGLELEELKMLLHNQLILLEEMVVEEEEDSDFII
jgi:hypothetical protein